MRREYDGLTGQEVLDLLLLELRQQLEKEGRLSYSQAYHNVEISGEFKLTSYPHEPPVEVFKVKAKVGKDQGAAKATVETVKFGAKHDVPDLAREGLKAQPREVLYPEGTPSRSPEEIMEAVKAVQHDVALLTQAEGKSTA